MDLSQAIEKHAEWKVKLRGAITKKEQLDHVTIGKDNCCELGKWLHGDGHAKHGHLPSFRDCVTKHAQFHTEAAKVAAAINAKDYTKAEALLGGGSTYAQASSAVGVAIGHLKKEI